MIELRLPIGEKEIRQLRVGDQVGISGIMVTARDAAHHYLTKTDATEVRDFLRGGMIYHCGPVVAREGGEWRFVAAGPTTSIREEIFEADVIARYGVRGIIGKGGMGAKTLAACRDCGCVYLDAVGGLAVVLAQSVRRVIGVHKLDEFGAPEAMWVIEVERFPATVAMDTHGESVYRRVEEASAARVQELLSPSGNVLPN
jgi:fumarate hydratase class I